MKLSIDIDCTPEEARAFLGLPSVEEFNKAVMEQVQAQVLEHMRGMDAETLYKNWFPAGVQAWEQFQQAFTGGFAGAGKKK